MLHLSTETMNKFRRF